MAQLTVYLLLATVALLLEPVAQRLKLPFSLLLLVVGFVGSELWVALGYDTGLRWQLFEQLILHVLVPLLVFESAFHLPLFSLWRNLLLVLLLAVPALLVAALITATVLYWGIGYPGHFTWLTALLAGVIVSATDPVAVVNLCKALGAPQRLAVILEGESLFNDATAVVLFTLLLASFGGASLEPGLVVADFIRHFIGGVLVGGLVVVVTGLLYRLKNGLVARHILSVTTAVVAFTVAEQWCHVSGIVAVLIAGLWLGEVQRRYNPEVTAADLWHSLAYLANSLVFLLMGATITVTMFQQQWLAMVLGVVGATLARVITVYGLLPLLQPLQGWSPLNAAYRHVVMWGGLRGAVAVALALSLPTDIPAWFTVQSLVYGVVIFTLLLQTPWLPRLIRRCD